MYQACLIPSGSAQQKVQALRLDAHALVVVGPLFCKHFFSERGLTSRWTVFVPAHDNSVVAQPRASPKRKH